MGQHNSTPKIVGRLADASTEQGVEISPWQMLKNATNFLAKIAKTALVDRFGYQNSGQLSILKGMAKQVKQAEAQQRANAAELEKRATQEGQGKEPGNTQPE